LGGRYVTACDVGTYVEDMDVVARECRWVTGRSPAYGGSGDSGVLTAYGVMQGMRACAEHLWGSPSLAGRRVAVAGLGKVGSRLVGHLLDDGAAVIAADVTASARERLRARHPAATVVADPEELVTAEADVYAPCALGGVLTDEVVSALTARVVCGGANNQLAHPGIDEIMVKAGILYAPDFVVNAGGLIQVADEIEGFQAERAKSRAAKIFDTTLTVIEHARHDGVTTATAAEALARRRMTDVGQLRGLLVSGR
jgi:valine dehydrogenase (NAD+)